MKPIERLRAALSGQTKGWRGPQREQRHAGPIFPADIIAVAEPLQGKSQVIDDLLLGSQRALAAYPNGDVFVQVDDLFALVESSEALNVNG